MSALLKIKFADDMMASAVDVVSSQLEIVDRVMLAPGDEKVVQVPSETSFLRLHLPSGKIVILHDPGNLDRLISWKDVRSQLKSRFPRGGGGGGGGRSGSVTFANEGTEAAHAPKYALASEPELTPSVHLGHYGLAQVLGPAGQPLPGRNMSRGAKWKLTPEPTGPPLSMVIVPSPGAELTVRLPHDLTGIRLRTQGSRKRETLTMTINLKTTEPAADAILGYLQRGDLYSAQAMTQWVVRAKEMLFDKMKNAYAASVGAYLLLRLRMFNHLHDWPKNLADRFTFLPDGCIIWAWFLIYQRPSEKREITRYLLMAVDRGVPIYSEGLRLLTDGLRLLSTDAQPALNKLAQQIGVIVPNSPVAATITDSSRSLTHSISYKIEIGN
jgi:hypothetical protein